MGRLLYQKSVKDLSRRKARTILTVLTIALGVMGMSLFAVSPLAKDSVADEMNKERLYNLRLMVEDVDLSADQLEGLAGLPNVEAVSARSLNFARYQRGERRADVLVVGIPDMEDADVDRVILREGNLPGPGEALTEVVNEDLGYLSVSEGDTITLLLNEDREVRISGTGRSMAHGRSLYDAEGYAVLYVDMGTARDLFGGVGFNYLSFRLEDVSLTDATIEDIRTYLTENTDVVAFETLPDVREDGEWPGGEYLDMILNISYILTLIAILASVFLISSTMRTMVAESKKEIAMLKAIGASRAQVVSSFFTSALSMGIAGSIMGALAGIGLSYLVLLYFGDLMGFTPGRSVHFPTVLISAIAGLFVVGASSAPALARASWTTVREGMEEGVSSGHKGGVLEKVMSRATFVPRSVQMGIRNTTRKRGRSVTTVLQTGLAFGLFMGLLAFASSLGTELSRTIDNLDYDIELHTVQGGEDMTEDLASEIAPLEGVNRVEPYLQTMFIADGTEVYVMGYLPDTEVKRRDRTLVEGEWFSGKGYDNGPFKAVIGEPLSERIGKGVGDDLMVTTPTGEETLSIIGIDDDFYFLGLVIYLPLEDLQGMLRQNASVTGFFVHTVSEDHDIIDRTVTMIEDLLSERGFAVDASVIYETKEATIESNQAIVYAITVLSSFIVIISMIGLTSNLTMGIIERTREIGMLRCVGAVSMRIRSIFTIEALTLTLAGWLLGVPLGYIIARGISAVLDSMMDWSIPIRYPVTYIMFGLALVVIVTLVISQGPIHRATRMNPGDAIRYQ